MTWVLSVLTGYHGEQSITVLGELCIPVLDHT